MLARDFYLKKLIRNMWNGEVKVITGLRRCGKSVLLFTLFDRYLREQGVSDDDIIRIELDQRKNSRYRNPITLCDYVEGLVANAPDRKFYLLIDEVQMAQKVNDKESGVAVSIYDMLNELNAYDNLDVYVTGSNSKGLSSDIATEFRGRATQIHVYPLSFEEYYSAVGGSERDALDDYMVYGGMPRLLSIQEEADKKAYLQSLFQELYVKDIVERNGIEREDILGDLMDYMAAQISSLTNPNNVANALTSLRHENINSVLITQYLNHMVDAFLISIARRYDVKGKSYFKYPNKYYYTDIGLRNARLNYRQFDTGHITENLIYNDLLRQGYSVDVGVVYDRANGGKVQKEIDFIVNAADRRVYIQSAFQIGREEKEDSELSSLMLTGDFFRKIVVRTDIPHSFFDDNGIQHCKLTDFLLGRIALL